MAHDVFISYAKGDRSRAAELASILETKGWSVWWDRDILPGRTFDDVIEEALTGARSVVVLWSAESVKSRWVRAEASAGAERDALVPVLIEPVTIPLEFRRVEAAKLTHWKGDGEGRRGTAVLPGCSWFTAKPCPYGRSHPDVHGLRPSRALRRHPPEPWQITRPLAQAPLPDARPVSD